MVCKRSQSFTEHTLKKQTNKNLFWSRIGAAAQRFAGDLEVWPKDGSSEAIFSPEKRRP